MISYEDIIENLSEGVIGVDLAFNVAVFNQAAERMAEVSRGMVLGRPVREVLKRDLSIAAMIEKTLSEGRLFAEYEERLSRRLSGPLPVGVTTSQVFDASGNLTGAIALLKDLTGIKSLEEESLRKDRLAYIGTFSANLAHEIKNPLGGIRGAAQLLSRRITEDKLLQYASVIVKEADRLNSIVNGMLDFARPARLEKRPVNIHRVLDEVTLLSCSAGGCAFIKDYDPSLPPVSGDEGQLKQVFLNLVKNAVEATGKNGRVQVSTRVITDFHRVDAGGKGRMAAVEVRDNGCGINPEDLDKIFTPFFTTKAGGSGLGMPIAMKIIKEHGGHLRIDSSPRKGTAAVVYIPISEKGDLE